VRGVRLQARSRLRYEDGARWGWISTLGPQLIGTWRYDATERRGIAEIPYLKHHNTFATFSTKIYIRVYKTPGRSMTAPLSRNSGLPFRTGPRMDRIQGSGPIVWVIQSIFLFLPCLPGSLFAMTES
jgi:hypothetical protein